MEGERVVGKLQDESNDTEKQYEIMKMHSIA